MNALEPGEEIDVSIELQSPEQCGIYQSQYRLFTANNVPFGDPIWLVLNVEVGGVLGITQQLNSVNMFGNMSSNHNNNNCSSFNQFSPNFKTNAFNLSPQQTNLNQLASSSNLTSSDSAALLNKQQQLNDAQQTNQIFNNPILDDEKRPDFYDDMFS